VFLLSLFYLLVRVIIDYFFALLFYVAGMPTLKNFDFFATSSQS